MSIEQLIKESINIGLEINGNKGLMKELGSLVLKDVSLDETLFAIGKNSEHPLPLQLCGFSIVKENVEIANLLNNTFMEILNLFKKLDSNLDKIKQLIVVVYGIAYESEMYQEPWLKWRETKKQLNIFQEITIYCFSKIMKNPPPKYLLENKIYS